MKLPTLARYIDNESLVHSFVCNSKIRNEYAPWQTSVCMELVKKNVDQTNKFAHISIQDLTSAAAGTTEFTDEYLHDIEANFGEIIKQDIKPHFIENQFTEGFRSNYLVIDTSKIHGVIFLGLMNLFKATTENLTIPITYCYMKYQFPDLKFYQRLVLCIILSPIEYLNKFKSTNGQHQTFRDSAIGHVDGLTLQKIKSHWQKKELIDTKKPLVDTHCFNMVEAPDSYGNSPTDDISMNKQWLPEPWFVKRNNPYHGGSAWSLCKETVDAFCEPNGYLKIPKELMKLFILGYIT